MSGDQSPLVQADLAARSTSTFAPQSKKSNKGRTRAQGIHLLPLVLKWVRVTGMLLAIWLVGYFGFNVTWVLLAIIGYVLYGVYKGKKKAIKKSVAVDEDDEPILARVDELPAWVYFPDSERAEWLNKIIQQMWPFVGQFVEKILRSSVEEIINKHIPAKLTPFKFLGINLGNIPPRVGGVKAYTDNVKRDEIILDVDVTLASDAELTLSVRGISAGIKDIMIQGTVRVVMRPLINKMPIIGSLSLFFLNQPNFDFDLTEVANVLDMPLLSTTLRTIISDQIANFLVLPNKIPVQLIENIRDAQLQCLLPKGVIHLTVIEAKDLRKADVGILGKGKSDPYCKISFGSDEDEKGNKKVEFATNVIQNNLNPEWNKSYEIITEKCEGELIHFEVMDKDDPGPDDDLGTTALSIDDLPERGTVDQWCPLEGVKTGMLHVQATWLHLSKNPADLQKAKEMRKHSELESTALLVVYIDSAKDLPSNTKFLKEPNPYVRLEVGNREEKTTVKRSSTNPKWEQKFLFMVTDPEVQELTVEVLDDGHDRQKLGIRKVRLNDLLLSNDMAMSRPFTLKNASRECSIVMSLVLRILTKEIPARDEDDDDDDVDLEVKATVTANTKSEPKNQSMTESASSKDPMTDSIDSISETNRYIGSSSYAGDGSDVRDTSSLRHRGLNIKSDGRFGRVNLTIRYSTQRHRLVVVVHQCVNLIPCDSNNLADPYVRLYLLPDRSSSTKRETQTRKDELTPVYDETFEWAVSKADAMGRTLEVMVKNSVGPFSKQRVNMGVLHLNLSEIDDLSKTVSDWFDLQDPDAAEKSSNPSLHHV